MKRIKKLFAGLLASAMALSLLPQGVVAAEPVFVPVNETNFPDSNFRAYVLETIDEDLDGALSQSEIEATTSINVNSKSIKDLTGIEYFTELVTLSCAQNQLTTLDVSGLSKLSRLTCDNNSLTSLTTGSAPLTYIGCAYNSLTSLDLSGNSELTSLYTAYNSLTSLDVSNNTMLTALDCSVNEGLPVLDLSKNTELSYLNTPTCCIYFLDLSQNTKLDYVNISDNNLVGANLPDGMTFTTFLAGDQFFYDCYIDADDNYNFDMSYFSASFDGSRVSDLKGAGGIAGNVLQSLAVTELVTYKYDCGSGQSIEVTLHVTPKNSWTQAPAITDWIYGDEAAQPTAASKFGTVTFSYSDSEEGEYTQTVPENAGVYFMKATVEKGGNYPGLESEPIEFEIFKRTPTYTIPTGVTASEGDTLSDVTLPDGFEWQDDGSVSVGAIGKNTFKATYTPSDSRNYETVTGIDIVIDVIEAEGTIKPSKPSVGTVIRPSVTTTEETTTATTTSGVDKNTPGAGDEQSAIPTDSSTAEVTSAAESPSTGNGSIAFAAVLAAAVAAVAVTASRRRK